MSLLRALLTDNKRSVDTFVTQSQTVVLSNCDAVVLPTKRLPVLRCEAELKAAARNCTGDEKCIQLASLPPPLISFCVHVAEEGATHAEQTSYLL